MEQKQRAGQCGDRDWGPGQDSGDKDQEEGRKELMISIKSFLYC